MLDGCIDFFSGLELSNDQVPAQSDRNMACFDCFEVCLFFVKFPGSNFFPKIPQKSQKIVDFDVEIHRELIFTMDFDRVWPNMDRFSQNFVDNTLIFDNFSTPT